VSRISLYIN